MNGEVLFVCRENTGRSQVAMSYYNAFMPDMADSAGTQVFNAHQNVGEQPEADGVIEALKADGFDISYNKRKQVTEEMLPLFDRVIIMAEPHTVQDWLHQWETATYWSIPDLKGVSLKTALEIRNLIRDRVYELLWD